MKKMIKIILLAFFCTQLACFAQELPPKNIRAQKVGLDNSATCWVASVWAQGVFIGKPNLKDNFDMAKDLTDIYNGYGVLLVGQESFNNVVKSKTAVWKTMTLDDQTPIWKQCTTLWQAK